MQNSKTPTVHELKVMVKEAVENPAKNRLLSFHQVQPQEQLSRVTIWRWEKEGKFPKHIKLGRSIRWRESDIQAWIDGLQAA